MKKLCSILLSFFMAAGLMTAPVYAEETPIDVTAYGVVTDAGQGIDKLTIDFGDKKISGLDKDTFTVHYVSTIDYGANKGNVYAEKDIPIVKTEVDGGVATLYFDQSATASLTWLAEGRNYPAVLKLDVTQNKPLIETAPDGREVEFTGTYSCGVSSYKDLVDPEVAAYTDVQDVINYQFHKGTNDKLIVFFHGNGEGDFPVKDTNNNIAQILANRGGAAWVSEAQEVFGDASVMCFQAPNMWYFAVKDNLLEPCYNEIMKVVKDNGINEGEIYLSGASAGGFMCTRMIIAYPDLFKAAMINCPALDAANARSESEDAIPTDDELKKLLDSDTAIWLVQGETDSSVNPEFCSKRIWNIISNGQAVTSKKYVGDKEIASGFTTYETADNKYKLSLYETFDLNTITGLSGETRQGGKMKFAEDYDQDGVYTEVKYSDHWSWIYTLRNNPEAADGSHIWNWAVDYQPEGLPGTQRVEILGDDWGVGVTKTILKLDTKVKADSVKADAFTVVESKQATVDWATGEVGIVDAERKILDAYTSDKDGNKVDGASDYVAIEMYVSPSEGSPFIYRLDTGRNAWCDPYELRVYLKSNLTAEDGTVIKALAIDPAIDFSTMISPQLDKFDLTHKFTASDGNVYSYADYTGSLKDDGKKNPLLIWLNGGGEGGTDPSIVLLANEVTAFAGEEFQGVLDGSYVLVPQVPTYWLEGYDWKGEKDEVGTSIYNDSVMELIKDYVAKNDDIDADRIYVTGCSNGGYMTLNLAIRNPDFFGAVLPICEGYRDEDVTDEMIQAIKDLPLWFVFAANDPTLVPEIYCRNTIERLKAAGASNLHVSEFADVHDTTGRFTDEAGAPYQYSGHWSWVHFDNNECFDEKGVNCWEWLANQRRSNGSMIVNVVGDDWGPAVDKAIITLDAAVKAEDLKAEDFTVTEVKEAFDWGTFQNIVATTDRKVTAVYLSDEAGNKVDAAEGKIVTVEMYVSPNEGSPFFYELGSGFNRWVDQYELTVVGDGITVHKAFDFYDNDQWISPLADSFNQDTYIAPSGTPIVYGEFVPEKVTEEMPLVVWLHGAGEGTNKGKNDNYIDLLGNEVTAFADKEFQDTFGGAYVITPQAPTMWMDDGTGAYQNGDKGSCYADDLFEFIDWYVRKHPEINRDRVIVGGCSNGGYMTMEITMKHPGYFYKAFPICEAFFDEYITDEMIAAVKEGGTKYWFTYALTDTTVNPDLCSKPTIARFKEAGIETHVSEWAKVEDLTGRFTDAEGNPYEYSGHWSWIYFDNNANTEGDLNEWKWLAEYEGFMGFKIIDNKQYWFEDGIRQGTVDDPKNISDTLYNKVPRGREIYDPVTDAWYWLDADADGLVARNKEVWIPYLFQDDPNGYPEGKWVRYDKYGQMIKGWYANDDGVYYYDLITGAMYKGTQTINGKTYFFDPITGIRQ